MHQLREMLNKQEQLLHGMTGLSIVQHKNSNKLLELPEELEREREREIDQLDGYVGEDDLLKRKENISFLLERIEGCARLLDGSEKNVLKTGEALILERDETAKVRVSTDLHLEEIYYILISRHAPQPRIILIFRGSQISMI